MPGIQFGWGSEWETIANAINDYYGGGISSAQYQQVVQMLNSGEYTVEEMENILGNIPEFSRTYNANGQLVKVSYNATASTANTAGNVAHEINSNVANATKTQFNNVQTVTKDATTGTATISNEVKAYKNGTATTAKTIGTSAAAAIMATSVGIGLGKVIAPAMYNVADIFWDDVSMAAYNPETWNSITVGMDDGVLEKTGAALFNFMFQLDPDTNNPVPYMPEDVFAYMAGYLAERGFFISGNPLYPPTPQGTVVITGRVSPYDLLTQVSNNARSINYSAVSGALDQFISDYYTPSKICTLVLTQVQSIYEGWSPLSLYISTDDYPDNSALTLPESMNAISFETYGYGASGQTIDISNYRIDSTPGAVAITVGIDTSGNEIKYGNINAVEGEQPPAGTSNQPGAIIFDPSGITDIHNTQEVLNALKAQYPELWDNRIEISPDGENVHVYVPVGFPTGGTGLQPTTIGATQQQLAPDISGQGENATDELIKTIIDLIQHPFSTPGMQSDTDIPPRPINPNMPDTGTGSTPTVIVPSGSASALYSVYNPTQSELNSFGGWLWSSNFVDQLLKLFNDPMQAIIGLHKVFATPSISGRGPIKVGYLSSGVDANLVSAQYVTVSCGTVNLQEYFNNVLDYDPFTQVYLYLPFIGIEKLDTGDVMRGEIEVIYHVDVITGACLAEVNVTRDLGGGTIYTFSGNCAVQYPVSSGSYMGIIASAASIAGGVVGTIATGGAIAPVAMGAVSGVLNAHTRVQHSGGFSGNSGAMGIKKPYLIITRPQTALADQFQHFDGYPANNTTPLGNCTGYVKCSSVHLENVPATDTELTEIEGLLKTGVLI